MKTWHVMMIHDGGTSEMKITSRELRLLPQWFTDGTVYCVTISDKPIQRYGDEIAQELTNRYLEEEGGQ